MYNLLLGSGSNPWFVVLDNQSKKQVFLVKSVFFNRSLQEGDGASWTPENLDPGRQCALDRRIRLKRGSYAAVKIKMT